MHAANHKYTVPLAVKNISYQLKMQQIIKLKYLNPMLQIGMAA